MSKEIATIHILPTEDSLADALLVRQHLREHPAAFSNAVRGN